MDQRLQNFLDKYPILFKNINNMYMEFDIGWDELAHELCAKLEQINNECEDGKFIYCAQMKEKYASFTFYFNHWEMPEERSKVVFDLIEQATEKSEKTCEISGSVGSMHKKNWVYKRLNPEVAEKLGYEKVRNNIFDVKYLKLTKEQMDQAIVRANESIKNTVAWKDPRAKD
jgi:hypothetical protein